jgi:hypothetical protein
MRQNFVTVNPFWFWAYFFHSKDVFFSRYHTHAYTLGKSPHRVLNDFLRARLSCSCLIRRHATPPFRCKQARPPGDTQKDWEREATCWWEGMGEGAWSRIYDRKESLALCKSFNPLWPPTTLCIQRPKAWPSVNHSILSDRCAFRRPWTGPAPAARPLWWPTVSLPSSEPTSLWRWSGEAGWQRSALMLTSWRGAASITGDSNLGKKRWKFFIMTKKIDFFL